MINFQNILAAQIDGYIGYIDSGILRGYKMYKNQVRIQTCLLRWSVEPIKFYRV